MTTANKGEGQGRKGGFSSGRFGRGNLFFVFWGATILGLALPVSPGGRGRAQ